jgi:hypothetical protein
MLNLWSTNFWHHKSWNLLWMCLWHHNCSWWLHWFGNWCNQLRDHLWMDINSSEFEVIVMIFREIIHSSFCEDLLQFEGIWNGD